MVELCTDINRGKTKNRKKRARNRVDWEKSILRRQRHAFDCSAIEEKEEEEEVICLLRRCSHL